VAAKAEAVFVLPAEPFVVSEYVRRPRVVFVELRLVALTHEARDPSSFVFQFWKRYWLVSQDDEQVIMRKSLGPRINKPTKQIYLFKVNSNFGSICFNVINSFSFILTVLVFVFLFFNGNGPEH